MDANDNEAIKKSAEDFIKNSTNFLSDIMKSIDTLKQDFMKDPKQAQAFSEQLAKADINGKIQEINNILNTL